MSRNSKATSSQPKPVRQHQTVNSCALHWRTTSVQVYADYTKLFSLAHGKNIGATKKSKPTIVIIVKIEKS